MRQIVCRIGGLGFAAFFLAACTSSSPRSTTSPTNPVDYRPRSDYLRLVSLLGEPVLRSSDEPQWRKDLSHVVAEGQVRALALRELTSESEDSAIRLAAEEAAIIEAGDELPRMHS